MNNSSSIFQQNSKAMLGMKCLTPDRISNKKVIEFNQFNDLSNSINHSISTDSSTNIFFKPYQLEFTSSIPKQVSSDRCISINQSKLMGTQDIKKSAFFNHSQNQLPQSGRQEIIDWVSGNNSIKFEDIMKTPIQTIKLREKNPNNNSLKNINTSINNSNSKQDISKIQNEFGDVEMTSSIILTRRTRRNIPKSLDENSFMSLQSPVKNQSPSQSILKCQQNSENPQKNQQIESSMNSSKNISSFSQYNQQEFTIKKDTKIIKNQSKSQPSSIEKIYDEFLQHSSEPTFTQIENDEEKSSSKTKHIKIKNNFQDKHSSLSNLLPQQENNQFLPNNSNTSRRRINFTKLTEENNIGFNSHKLLTEGDIDDFLSTRPHSNTFDISDSKRTTSPSTTSSLSKNSLYKSILKQPKEKALDFFGDLVDATKSPKNKKVSFAHY